MCNPLVWFLEWLILSNPLFIFSVIYQCDLFISFILQLRDLYSTHFTTITAGVEEIQYISSLLFFFAIYKPEINKRNKGQFLNNVIQVGIVGGGGWLWRNGTRTHGIP